MSSLPFADSAAAAICLDHLITACLASDHFWTGNGLELRWGPPGQVEEVAWELFRGRLLDAAQTRQRRVFVSWNLFAVLDGQTSPEPLLSVKLDRQAGLLHVVRAILSYAWEAFDQGNNVILSRETQKWLRELVGTIDLAEFSDPHELSRELCGLLFEAVVGTSRLALTSLETPLPAFSLGQLMYVPRRRPQSGPQQNLLGPIELGHLQNGAERERAKLLEFLFRACAAQELHSLPERLLKAWPKGHDELPALFRTVFNEVALTPYTSFVQNCLVFWREAVARRLLDRDAYIDFLSWLLRQLARHLTAYDLITFHHRGANYPDALLLDAVLREALELVQTDPTLCRVEPCASQQALRRKQLRRRGLRMGQLLWQECAGLPIPMRPTSAGENQRVLPAAFPRVPEEELFNPGRRRFRLYEDRETPVLPEWLSEQFLADLQEPEEVLELGTALFLERPLGFGKAIGEPDRTPLLTQVAFSPSIARRRQIALLRREATEILAPLTGVRVPLAWLAKQAGYALGLELTGMATDFVVLRTTTRTMQEFLNAFDFSPLKDVFSLDFLAPDAKPILSGWGGPSGQLTVYDRHGKPRLVLEVPAQAGYRVRGGRELPAAGLRAVRGWSGCASTANEREVPLNLWIPPRK